MTAKSDDMIERFGPAIEGLLEESSIKHLWRLAFLVSFFIEPLYVEISKRFGVGRQEVQILYCLTRHEGLLAQDIALVTGQPKNSISRAVSQLVKKDYLIQTTRTNDRRTKSLKLTNSGRELVSKVMPSFRTRQDSMRLALTETEQKRFDALINKIVYAMPDWIDIETTGYSK